MTRRIGILFEQFAAYHVDRCEAAVRRLEGRAEVVAVEVASASRTYAWSPSGEVRGAIKRVLFPGARFEDISWWRRFRAQREALRDCDTVFIGIGYNRPEVPLLAAAVRLAGRRAVLMSESKFDDRPRGVMRELAKRVLLGPFSAALVGGPRQADYMRRLGFRRRQVLTGYDGVDLERVRTMAGAPTLEADRRPFVFVGRFVEKKNIAFLLDAYAEYRRQAIAPRRLVLVGGGELEPELRRRIAALDLANAVEITGFVGPEEVARRLVNARALLLPSRQEQWGLVVNEALAVALPAVVSQAVGAGDTLVEHGGNGFVLPRNDAAAWAGAMLALDADEARWRAMSEVSRRLAHAGDTERFAEGVAALAAL